MVVTFDLDLPVETFATLMSLDVEKSKFGYPERRKKCFTLISCTYDNVEFLWIREEWKEGYLNID